MKTVYVIGDSHNRMVSSEIYRNDIHPVLPHGQVVYKVLLGDSWTAYSLPSREQEVREALSKSELGAVVLSLYGEIDCRFYIFNRHIWNGSSLDAEIDQVVNNYIPLMRTLRFEGHNMVVVSVVPPQRIVGQAMDPAGQPGGGGLNEDRRYITEVLNSKLKYACHEQGVPFLDLYHLQVDTTDGYNRPELLWPRPEETMHYRYMGKEVEEILLQRGFV